MKNQLFMSAIVLSAVLLLNTAFAQMMGRGPEMMQEYNQKQQQPVHQGQQSYSDKMYGMIGGYGFDPRMMQNYAMRQGMMHRYDMGHDGMMQGYGGMGYGMMGGQGYCQGPVHMWNYKSEEDNKFMEETKETRKKLHDLHFEYGEIMRNPKTTVEDLRNMEKKIYELQQKLRKKANEQ